MERAKAAAFSALEFLETLNEWFAQRRNGETETNSEATMGDACFYRLTMLEAALHSEYPEDWPPDYKPDPPDRDRIRDEALEEAAALADGIAANPLATPIERDQDWSVGFQDGGMEIAAAIRALRTKGDSRG